MDKAYQNNDDDDYGDEAKSWSLFQRGCHVDEIRAACQAFRVWSDTRQAKIWTTAVFDSTLEGRDTNLVSHRLLQSLGYSSSTVRRQTQQFQTLAGTIRSIGSLELKLSPVIFSSGAPQEQAVKCVKFHILTDDALLADMVLGADYLSRNPTFLFIEQAFDCGKTSYAHETFQKHSLPLFQHKNLTLVPDLLARADSVRDLLFSAQQTTQNNGFSILTDVEHASPMSSELRASRTDYNSAALRPSGHDTMSSNQLNRLRQVLESSRAEVHTVVVDGESNLVCYYDCPCSGCRHTWTNGFRQIQDLCQHIIAVHLREI